MLRNQWHVTVDSFGNAIRQSGSYAILLHYVWLDRVRGQPGCHRRTKNNVSLSNQSIDCLASVSLLLEPFIKVQPYISGFRRKKVCQFWLSSDIFWSLATASMRCKHRDVSGPSEADDTQVII